MSLGTRVPVPEVVADTVNVVLLIEVTAQATPVAVPAFMISEAVNDEVLTGSLNTSVKFTGTELVTVGWPDALANEETLGPILSWVYVTIPVQLDALPTESTALAWIPVAVFTVNPPVVTVWPGPATSDVSAEMASVHETSLYRVTAAASDRSMVTVGVWLWPGLVGATDV
jgi:hypothetical protein